MGNVQRVDSQAKPFRYEFNGNMLSAEDVSLKRAEFEPHPFDCGKFRVAFRGKVYVGADAQGAIVDRRLMDRLNGCWQRQKDRPYYPCIVKAFKRSRAMQAAEWNKDLQALDEATLLAPKFNRDVKPVIPWCQVMFASAFLYEVSCVGSTSTSAFCQRRNTQTGGLREGERVCVEPELEGEFIKANCNNGYVSKKKGHHIDVAQAFSHYSWWVTKGELLICDLQGVLGKTGWKFTDPAIHSQEGQQRFGVTDLGPRGINAFFCSHTCNEICWKWEKPQTLVDLGMDPVAYHTTFSFEQVQVSSAVHSQQDFANILGHEHAGTCYAHAAATIICASERRIVGRSLERHFDIVSRLVQKHGSQGANPLKVLTAECGSKRLRCATINAGTVENVLQMGRAVLVSFWLDKNQWSSLSSFFESYPSGVLEKLPDRDGSEVSGHSVIIIGCDQKAWKIKNSWGDGFADDGYFRFSRQLLAKLQAEFIDVFFLECDLRDEDKKAYIEYCHHSPLRTFES
ncbi:Alpha-protein kinase 1 (AK1) [Durusdinium trenchii]|uniref:Alpha-protein kinase 1 (AK1) n=1 Tax=Durusdinium trenchii TaxID=1381693 RepID=A0ABP0JAQ6_9DINO